MRTVYLAICCILLLSSFVSGQNDSVQTGKTFDPEVLKSQKYQDGIYLTISEFLTNSPSEKISFNDEERREFIYNCKFGKSYTIKYYDDSLKKFKKFKKDHWGMCFENKVYIKDERKYMLLDIIGKYSVYTTMRESHGSSSGFGIGGGYSYQGVNNMYYPIVNSGGSSNVNDYVINLETNERFHLNLMNLKILLQKEDPSLFQQFENEDDKKTKLYLYIKYLNENYK